MRSYLKARAKELISNFSLPKKFFAIHDVQYNAIHVAATKYYVIRVKLSAHSNRRRDAATESLRNTFGALPV